MSNGGTGISRWVSLSRKSAFGLAMTLTSDLENLFISAQLPTHILYISLSLTLTFNLARL